MFRRFWKNILLDFPTTEFPEYLDQKSGLESKPPLKIERVPLELNLISKRESELEKLI